jgi:hypothetical protein
LDQAEPALVVSLSALSALSGLSLTVMPMSALAATCAEAMLLPRAGTKLSTKARTRRWTFAVG